MNSGFDIYDEWGIYKGRFTPAWSTDGCLGMVLGAFLLAIGFLIYLLIKLTINGFKSAIAGDLGKALLYWSIPAVFSGLFVLFIIFSFMNVFAISSQSMGTIPSPLPNMLNPQGGPLAEWNGIPVMPQAEEGQEIDKNNYSFKYSGIVKEAVDFYSAKMVKLGWSSTLSMPENDQGAILLFSKESSMLTVTIKSTNNIVVVILTFA